MGDLHVCCGEMKSMCFVDWPRQVLSKHALPILMTLISHIIIKSPVFGPADYRKFISPLFGKY